MSNFPLYDNLSKNVKNKDLTVKQKEDFISYIQNMSSNDIELIYALIKTYEIENKETYPYIKHENNDIEFDLDKFSFSLKQILHKFIGMHKQKIKEDIKRDDNINLI